MITKQWNKTTRYVENKIRRLYGFWLKSQIEETTTGYEGTTIVVTDKQTFDKNNKRVALFNTVTTLIVIVLVLCYVMQNVVSLIIYANWIQLLVVLIVLFALAAGLYKVTL